MEDRLQLIITANMAKAKNEVNSFKKSVDVLGSSIKEAFESSAIIGWASTLKNITETMIKATEAEAEYVESMNLLQVAYRQDTEEGKKLLANTDELIATLKNFYGLDESKLVSQLGVYKQMTSAMGLTNSASAQLSEGLIKLQEDVSSLYNLDFSTVGKKFQSALAGQARALYSLGVDITKTNLQQELYNLGIDKNVNSLSRADKAILTFIALQRQLANANGDAANTINSVANQTKIFREQMAVAGRQIGAIFIPVLKTILPYLNGILMAFNAIMETLLSFLGINVKSLAGEFGIKTVKTGIDGIGVSAGKAGKAVDDLSGKLRGFDKLNVITTPKDTGSAGSVGGGVGGGVSKELLDAMNSYNDELEKAKNKATEIKNAILDWLGFTINENGEIDGFKLKLGTIVGALIVGGVVWKGVKSIFGIVKGIGGLLSTVGSVGKGVKNVTSVLTGSKDIASSATGLKVPKISTVLKGLADVALIIGGVIAIVQVLGLLQQEPGFKENNEQGIEALKTLFGGLAEIMIPMAAFTAGIALLGKQGMTPALKGMADFVVIVGGTIAVVDIIGYFQQKYSGNLTAGIKSIKELFEGLKPVFIPMAAFTAGIVALGLASPGMVLSGMAGFALVIGGLEAILIAMGAISKIPFVKELASGGMKMMIDLATFLGEFAGSIIKGFADKATDGLGAIGTHLAEFMTNSQPFFDGLSQINETLLNSAGTIAGIILSLTASNVLDALTGWFTGGVSFARFGEELAEFAPYFKTYADTITSGGVDVEAVEASTNAAKAISELYNNLPGEGGIGELFTGRKNLSGFSEILPVLADNMVDYSKKVSGKIDSNAVTASVNAAKSIMELYKELPNTGGLGELFAGKKDLSGFADILPKLAENMVGYSSKVSGKIDAKAVEASVNAAKSIMQLYKELPDTGGLAQLFAGKKDLSGFADILPKLADNMVSYSSKVSGKIDAKAVEASVNAAKSIAELHTYLPNTGGLAQLFAGKQDLKGFGEVLPSFGENLAKYNEYVSGKIDAETVKASVNAAKSILELNEMMPKSGGILQIFTGSQDLSDFGGKLAQFGEKFAQYSEKIQNVDTNKVNSITEALKSLVNLSERIQGGGLVNTMKDFANGLNNSTAGFNNFFSRTNASNIGYDFGKNIGSGIVSGIRNTNYPTIKLTGDNNYQYKTFKLSAYADGGFVDKGELFLANEAGAEMVGSINGKTAVANNDQIVEAISIGVAKAMSGRSTNVNIIADGDTQGLMKFINFKQQQQNRQYGL